LSYGAEIIRGSRHQIAGAMLVKEREWLVDKMLVENLPHVVLDIARHVDEYPALQKEKETADKTRAHNFAGGKSEFRPGDLSPILVDCPANDEGNKKTHGRAGKDAEYSER
jgi:hypothetical protein